MWYLSFFSSRQFLFIFESSRDLFDERKTAINLQEKMYDILSIVLNTVRLCYL